MRPQLIMHKHSATVYNTYPFGPTLLDKAFLFRIINRLGVYSPLNYILSPLLEKFPNTVNGGLGPHPLYCVRELHGQQCISCHESM